MAFRAYENELPKPGQSCDRRLVDVHQLTHRIGEKAMLWIPKHLQSCFESAFKGSSQISIGEFPKIRDTLFGVLIIKLLLFRVLY